MRSPAALAIALIGAVCLSTAATNVDIQLSREIDTVASSDTHDTLGVTLTFFAEGQYDTLMDTTMTIDTIVKPVDAVIYIDNTLSMSWDDNKNIDAAKFAAKRFVGNFAEPDRAALVITGLPDSLKDKSCDAVNEAVDHHTHLEELSPLTMEYDTVIQRIENLELGTFCNRSVWRDAVIGASEYALANSEEGRQPTVVLLSDGADRGSGYTAQEVIAWVHERAESDSLRLFMVGLGEGVEATEMRQVATVSEGGRYWGASDADGLAAVYDSIRGLLTESSIDTTYEYAPIPVAPEVVRNPIDVAMYIDNTLSMETDGRIFGAKLAASRFIEKLESPDRASLLITSIPDSLSDVACTDLMNRLDDHSYVEAVSPYTEEYDTLRQKVEDLELGTYCNRSVWRDAVIGAGRYAIENTQAGRIPTLILLSDGADRGSVNSVDEVVAWVEEKAASDSLRIFTIAFGDISEAAQMALVARASHNGKFFSATTSAQLGEVYETIGGEIITNVGARSLALSETMFEDDYYVDGSLEAIVDTTDSNSIAPDTLYAHTTTEGLEIVTQTKVVPVWGTVTVRYLLAVPNDGSVDVTVDDFYRVVAAYQTDDFTEEEIVQGKERQGTGVGRRALVKTAAAPRILRHAGAISVYSAVGATIELYLPDGRLVERRAIEAGKGTAIALRTASRMLLYRVTQSGGRTTVGTLRVVR
jgi:hypothetical protein